MSRTDIVETLWASDQHYMDPPERQNHGALRDAMTWLYYRLGLHDLSPASELLEGRDARFSPRQQHCIRLAAHHIANGNPAAAFHEVSDFLHDYGAKNDEMPTELERIALLTMFSEIENLLM